MDPGTILGFLNGEDDDSIVWQLQALESLNEALAMSQVPALSHPLPCIANPDPCSPRWALSQREAPITFLARSGGVYLHRALQTSIPPLWAIHHSHSCH